MKLRHMILLTSAIGACGALLLAADLYRRLKEAETAAALASVPARDDSVLTFGMYHTIGLLSLAFFFLAMFLIFLSASRDKEFVAAVDGTPAPQERSAHNIQQMIAPAPGPIPAVVVDAVVPPMAPVEVKPAEDSAPTIEPPPLGETKPIEPVQTDVTPRPSSEPLSDNHFAGPTTEVPPDNQTPKV